MHEIRFRGDQVMYSFGMLLYVDGRVYNSSSPVRIVFAENVLKAFEEKFGQKIFSCQDVYIRTERELITHQMIGGKWFPDINDVHLVYIVSEIEEFFLEPLPKIGYTIKCLFNSQTIYKFSDTDVATDLISLLDALKDYPSADPAKKEKILAAAEQFVEELRKI